MIEKGIGERAVELKKEHRQVENPCSGMRRALWEPRPEHADRNWKSSVIDALDKS